MIQYIKENKIKFAFFAVMLFMIFAFIIYCIIYSGNPFEDILFINPTDMFMDFYNCIAHVKVLDPYGPEVMGSYPALPYLLFAVFKTIVPMDVVVQGGAAIRENQVGQMVFILYTIVAVISFAYLIYANKKGSELEKIIFIMMMFFTTPFLFMFERGNIVFVAMIFTAVFVFYKDSQNKVLSEIALISLAVAASFKIYPAIFGILLIKEKRMKEAWRCIIYGVVLFVVPFVFFGGPIKIAYMLKYILKASGEFDAVGYGFKVNLSNTLLLCADLLNIHNSILDTIFKILPYVTLLVGVAVSLFIKIRWKEITLITALLVAVPNFSNTYTLVFMVIPLVLFLDYDGKRNILDWIYMFLFAAQFVPVFRGIRSLFVSLYSPYPVTAGTLVESLSIGGMILLLICEGIYGMMKNKSEKGRLTNEN